MSPLRERFTEVYDRNMWGDAESRSGVGSRRDSGSVIAAVEALHMARRNFGVRSINDIPCGDFNWFPIFLEQAPDITYRGFDIVESLVQGNRSRFPGLQFVSLDIVQEVPPRADLIFCKDMLNHLSYADVSRALANMKASNSTHLLATNNFGYQNCELASDLPASRHLDITAAPFRYPEPIWKTHYLGLWELSKLPN